MGERTTRVLVVDDDADCRAMLVFTLRRHGYDVDEAPDGAPALELLGADPPDVMVLDLMMPFDGYAVLEAMRERPSAHGTRVVVLTCKTDERDLVRAWGLGADEYLTKPVDPDVLAVKIGELAAQRARTPAG